MFLPDVLNKRSVLYAYERDKIGQERENTKQYLDDNLAVYLKIKRKMRKHYRPEAEQAEKADAGINRHRKCKED